jgi:hypothetical protein
MQDNRHAIPSLMLQSYESICVFIHVQCTYRWGRTARRSWTWIQSPFSWHWKEHKQHIIRQITFTIKPKQRCAAGMTEGYSRVSTLSTIPRTNRRTNAIT